MNNVNLSGQFASSLDVVSLSSTDFLLVSEPILKNVHNSQYSSKHIDFSTLSSAILDNIRDIQKFGSMAFEQSSDYALIDHQHACYSKVASVSALLSANDNTICIGSITVDNQKTDLYAPKAIVKQIPKPLVGQLKFVHHVEKKTIDIMSEDFDGWVYADGTQYECGMFEGSTYAFDNDGRTFSVPSIGSFIKPNSKPYSRNDISETYEHVDPYHNHNIHMNLSGNVDGKLYYKYASYGKGSTSHGSKTAITTRNYSIELDYSNIRISSKSVEYIKPAKTDTDETYPSYVSIPVMVYIGFPRPANSERTSIA